MPSIATFITSDTATMFGSGLAHHSNQIPSKQLMPMYPSHGRDIRQAPRHCYVCLYLL